jgi:hypothetical protein
MSKKFNAATMFDKIKGALSKPSGGGQFENIMKFPAGKTYVLRLLPTIDDDKEPLFHHWVNSWTSKSTGGYISAISLKTFGENDPISNLRWKLWKAWKEANPKAENKEYKADITEKEQWLVNAYVIDDPANPENNGKVKIFRFGPQIKEIIDLATEGERSDELGYEIFDPTAGHDLKIIAETQGEYTTYKNSFFTTKSKTILTDEDVEGLYENLHDLTQVYSVKTVEELQTLLNDHYFVAGEKEEQEERVPLAKAKADKPKEKSKEKPKAKKEEEPKTFDEDPDDDIPFEFDDDTAEAESDEDIDELLAGLDD